MLELPVRNGSRVKATRCLEKKNKKGRTSKVNRPQMFFFIQRLNLTAKPT